MGGGSTAGGGAVSAGASVAAPVTSSVAGGTSTSYFGFGFHRPAFFFVARRWRFFKPFFFAAGIEVRRDRHFDRRHRPFAFAVALARQGEAGEGAAEDEHHDQRQGEKSPARRRARSRVGRDGKSGAW